MSNKMPKGSVSYGRYDTSSCSGAFATTSATPDSLATQTKNAFMVGGKYWLTPAKTSSGEQPPPAAFWAIDQS